MARARPPWLRMMTGSSMMPAEMAAPSLSRRPEEVMWVTTPFLMCSISGSCTLAMELGAIEMSLMPMRAISSSTMFIT